MNSSAISPTRTLKPSLRMPPVTIIVEDVSSLVVYAISRLFVMTVSFFIFWSCCASRKVVVPESMNRLSPSFTSLARFFRYSRFFWYHYFHFFSVIFFESCPSMKNRAAVYALDQTCVSHLVNIPAGCRFRYVAYFSRALYGDRLILLEVLGYRSLSLN